MNWLKKLFRPKVDTSRKAAVARPVRHDMTLERWQTDDGLVNWAKQSEEFSYVLSVVQSLRPAGFPMRGQVVSETQCLVEFGRSEGYADCLRVLFALRHFPAKAEQEIEADYDNTEYPQASEG